MNFIRRWCDLTEYAAVAAWGRIAGIGAMVRYLRNPNPRVTPRLLRAFGARVGSGSTFKGSVRIDNAFEDLDSAGDFSHLQIGRNCYVGDGVYFDLARPIVLGDNCLLSGEAGLVTHADCNRSPWLAARFPRQAAPVHIGDGAWLGFRAVVLSGVTVGECAVVAAGALLREDAEPRGLYAGVPACRIRGLDVPPDRPERCASPA